MRAPIGLLLMLSILVLDLFKMIDVWTPHIMFFLGLAVGINTVEKEQA